MLVFLTALPLRPPATIAQSDQVRFAVIGDFGSNSQAEGDVADLVKGWNPDFVVTLGDNNYPSGAAATIDQNIGQYYHELIYPYAGGYGAGATTNRFFPSLGNHDWYTIGSQPYLDYFTLPGNERYYDFTWGPVHFFAVDSDTNEPDGTSSSSTQAGWLQSALSASTAPWQVVYMHHPPFSSGSHGSTSRMQWPYQAWGADVVMAGHDHTYERILVDGLAYFVNGLGGASRYSFGTPVAGSQVRYNDDYGAMLVDATADSMTLQFISRAGSVIDTYTIGTAPGATPTPTSTPAPVGTVERRVAQSSDDAEERVADGAMYLTSSDLELTNDASYWGQQVVGVRFQNLGIPPAAQITSAYIELVTDETDSEPTSLVFHGQAGDDAPAFTSSDFDVSGRTTTAASVAWEDLPAWSTAGETHQTPDLSPIVQAIIHRDGWSSGNAMAFVITGSGQRTARSYDGNAGAAPLLHIAYRLLPRCETLDVDGNGWVDVYDVMVVASRWGTADPAYDFDASGAVDGADVMDAAVRWGDVCVRDLWVWDQTIATEPAAQAQFFDFAAEHAVRGVYLESEWLIGSDQPALAAFIAAAGARDISVELLFGYAPWALTPNHGAAIALAQAAVAFAQGLEGPHPAGLHFDVEPYTLPEWDSDMNGTANQFLDLLEALAGVTASTGLRLTVDIPFWFDDRQVTRNSQTRPLSEWVIDRVDRVAIMDYRDHAGPPDGIIDHAASEVTYAATVGKQVAIGVETNCGLSPEKITFYEEGAAALDAALDETRDAYGGAPAFAGFAVHDYAGYRALGP